MDLPEGFSYTVVSRDGQTMTITLRRETWTPPESYPFGEAQLKPLRGGETLSWRLA